MHTFQKLYVTARQRSLQGIHIDVMAAWLITTILGAQSEDFPEPKHIIIGDGSARGWALYVGAHRQEFAGTVEHIRVGQEIAGRLVLRQVLAGGEYGPIIYTAMIGEGGVTYADGSVVNPHYVGETTNDVQIRKRIAIGMLFAIQESLPESGK